MLTIQQKAQCVLWYHKLKSPTAVQRKFRNEFGQDPHTNSKKRWFKNFMEIGSILDRKRSSRPNIDEETVDAVRVVFHRSPRKSIRVASNELAIPRSTVRLMQHELISLGCDEILHAQHQQSLHQCLAYSIFCDPKCCRFP